MVVATAVTVLIAISLGQACGRVGFDSLQAPQDTPGHDMDGSTAADGSTLRDGNGEVAADASTSDDAATPDAAAFDGGLTIDGGPAPTDAGAAVDAGPGDATVGLDTGPPDSGPPDGGPILSPGVSDGLIAWYRFEDDPNDGVSDASGNDRDGSCQTGECPTVAPGRVGSAYNFDGNDDYILVSDADAYFDGSAAYTVAGWIFVRGSTNQAAFSKPFGDRLANSWQVEVEAGESSLTNTASGKTYVPNSHEPDQWIHYAGTWNGTTVRFYRNGSLIFSDTGTMEFDTSAIIIGADINDQTRVVLYLDGLVDELVIYDRALSEAEVTILANP